MPVVTRTMKAEVLAEHLRKAAELYEERAKAIYGTKLLANSPKSLSAIWLRQAKECRDFANALDGIIRLGFAEDDAIEVEGDVSPKELTQ